MNSWQLKRGARCIRQGGVVAYPTEAVWGLGCDPWQETAVQRLLQLKRRPQHKGLILVAADPAQFDFLLLDLPETWQAHLQASWPGPHTWLVPHYGRVPRWISGNHDSVALRVSDHPLVQALCRLTGPLVSTSANLAGQPAARTRLQVQLRFGRHLDGLLNAPLGGRQQPSLIRDLRSGAVLRPA